MKTIRATVILAVITALTLCGPVEPAHAFGLCLGGGIGIGDCGTPTVNANVNANANVTAKLQVDGTQVSTLLQQVDRDNASLLNATNQAVTRGLSMENKAASQTLHDTTAQISNAIRNQLQQLATTSTDVVNQVGDRVDLQLKELMGETNSLAAHLQQATASLEEKISAQVNQTIAITLAGIQQQMQQLHADVLDTLAQIGSFLNEAIDQLYARSLDAAQTAHAQAVFDFGQLMLLGTKSGLVLGILLLVWFAARDGSKYVNKQKVGVPIELIVSGVLLFGGVTLLAYKPLLPAALGLNVDPATALVDVCSQAESEYVNFEAHVAQHADAESLRLEGGRVEEDLSHCAYSTLSKERANDANSRVASVTEVLHPPPQIVAKK